MWLISPEVGFVSMVMKAWDANDDTLTLRARVEADLVRLRRYIPDLSPISVDWQADYPFRCTAPRPSVAAAMAALVQDIRYDNVKDRISEVQGDQAAIVYHGVWSALRRLQGPRPRSDLPTIYASIGRRPDVLGQDDDENGSKGP